MDLLNRLEPGRPYPLGATADQNGVNFALFSENASSVTLVVFGADGRKEVERRLLAERSDSVWHGYLPGAKPGLVYGYRVDGLAEPERGRRFDPAKLLIDPYAKAFIGEFRWTDSHLEFGLDNARDTLKAVVVAADVFDWGDDRPPATPLAESVIYEVHVKGFTRLHPDIAAPLRGTYEGFVAPPAIDHLKRLGITAVSLLPVHQSISEWPLAQRGQTNYWGYSTIGFFAPDRRFAQRDPIREFKSMVKQLHAADIEVILDVVYNHTVEGDHTGPVLSFKGIDNENYYYLRVGHPGFYENFTGTGNALNLNHPRVLQMVMDSLRYWAGEMRVDGFRFDLATTLGRGPNGFDARADFFNCLRQDPLLARVKLIAEPWDVGFGGYQLGHFPAGFSEWNDRYRDSVRAFWVRKAAYRGEVASRLAGSSEVFRNDGRRPQASVNYIAAHDGFTLHDLVSYDSKHNEANGEDNRDGQAENRSWNCGFEGPTDLLAVNAVRGWLKRALLATLLVSQGTPMLLGGDELGRTQLGNNNAYCQDNELGWFDWKSADSELIAYTARLIELRRHYPQLRRTDWLTGTITSQGAKDILWLNRVGLEMSRLQWTEEGRYAFGILFGAATADERNLLVLLNAEASDWTMPLPPGRWRAVLDTVQQDGVPAADTGEVTGSMLLRARSLTLLEAVV
jgi:glycogen debranching enzyme GlgX